MKQSRKRHSDHTSTDTKNSVYVVRYLRGFEVGLDSVRGRARREWAPRARHGVCTVVLDSVVTGPLEAPTVVEESSILLEPRPIVPSTHLHRARQAYINDQTINYFHLAEIQPDLDDRNFIFSPLYLRFSESI